jgi:transcriptional regulator of nitric oxide reductase
MTYDLSRPLMEQVSQEDMRAADAWVREWEVANPAEARSITERLERMLGRQPLPSIKEEQ